MEVKMFPDIKPFGDSALLANWESVIDEDVHREVLRFARFVEDRFSEEILETVPAYSSVAIYCASPSMRDPLLSRILDTWIGHKEIVSPDGSFLVEVPVCYDEEFALDIRRVADFHGISEDTVIALHSQPVYKVYFTGFLPGFPYLGGLDERLHTPRLETPRPRVAMGAVGIGGQQTGVYTQPSPGGWNIIGRSPLHFFTPEKTPHTIVKAGDFLRFIPVDRDEFDNTLALVENGIYQLNLKEYVD